MRKKVTPVALRKFGIIAGVVMILLLVADAAVDGWVAGRLADDAAPEATISVPQATAPRATVPVPRAIVRTRTPGREAGSGDGVRWAEACRDRLEETPRAVRARPLAIYGAGSVVKHGSSACDVCRGIWEHPYRTPLGWGSSAAR